MSEELGKRKARPPSRYDPVTEAAKSQWASPFSPPSPTPPLCYWHTASSSSSGTRPRVGPGMPTAVVEPTPQVAPPPPPPMWSSYGGRLRCGNPYYCLFLLPRRLPLVVRRLSRPVGFVTALRRLSLRRLSSSICQRLPQPPPTVAARWPPRIRTLTAGSWRWRPRPVPSKKFVSAFVRPLMAGPPMQTPRPTRRCSHS
jgi:hypothetical protein